MESSGFLEKEEYDSVVEKHEKEEFKSNFSVFSDHNGFRKGELHIVVGPKGGSKSTFIKTAICEQLFNKKNIGLYLSEECSENYCKIFNDYFFKQKKDDEREDILSRLNIISELNTTEEQKRDFWDWIEFYLREKEIEIFFFDNFTTSHLSMGGVGLEGKNIIKLRKLAMDLNIPIISVHHTAKGTNVNKFVIDGDSTRGNAMAVNMGAYNYIITTLFQLVPPRTFILTDKSRYHSRANKKYYELNYNPEYGFFDNCWPSNLQSLTRAMYDQNPNTKKSKTSNGESGKKWNERS